jgi:aspartate/methionine/tyrosine aminotransferase
VSPSNPTGAVYSPAEVEAIGQWAVEKGIWVVTDEIYEHLVYGDAEFTSMPVLVPELADKCVVVNGVAKTYAMTGWRIGWMIGPNDIIKAATNLQSHATSNVANVSQIAALAAVSGDLSAVDEMKVAFDRRRQTITKMLNEIEGVVCPEPEGAFYVYPSVKNVLGREFRGKVPTTSAELAALILDEVEVAVVPGEAFGTPGYVRLSYALGDDDLIEGMSLVRLEALASGCCVVTTNTGGAHLFDYAKDLGFFICNATAEDFSNAMFNSLNSKYWTFEMVKKRTGIIGDFSATKIAINLIA